MREARDALRRDGGGGRHELRCPGVGLWRDVPSAGQLLRPGDPLGALEVLGRRLALRVPDGAGGIVVAVGGDAARARRSVDHGALLVVLDPSVAGVEPSGASSPASQRGGGLVFAAPSGGRFWSRPSPERAALVREGDVIRKGQQVFILEVMKTFTRVAYDGTHLPDAARIARIVPSDGDDLATGDPILELEPVTGG